MISGLIRYTLHQMTKPYLIQFTKDKRISNLVKYCEFESHYESIIDITRTEVLKLSLVDSTKALLLARMIESTYGSNNFCKVRLYNVDLLPSQSYFYEHDIFPLAFCRVVSNSSGLEWHLNDSVWSTNYKIPAFKTIHLKINTKEVGSIPKYTDKIKSIVITLAGDSET